MANLPHQGHSRLEAGLDGVKENSHTASTYLTCGLPTPLTATAPTFPTDTMNTGPPVSPMIVDSPPPSSRKRRAEDLDPDEDEQTAAPNASNAPRIVRRHRHRRRNVAASAWPVSSPFPGRLSVPYRPAKAEPFNVYKAILRHPNLFFQLALRLPYLTIIDLYAIDKEFHYRLNKYSVSLIHDYAKYHAPVASYIFSWVLFPELCISDPILKPMDGRPHLARDVPGFRWIKMVLWRQGIVKSILTQLGLEGFRVPRRVDGMLMKYWILMEMKSTALRQAFLRDTNVWTDTDILYFHLFLIKLDMRFSDPISGNGVCELSHMLLTQKSLSILYEFLIDKKKIDYDEGTDMLVRTYEQEDLDLDTHPWLDNEVENGVPEECWGLMCHEGWDMDGRYMEPAVDMVIQEGIRRKLHSHHHFPEFFLYGAVEGKRPHNVSRPRKWRWDEDIVVPNEGWPLESVRAKMINTLDERYGLQREEKQDDTEKVAFHHRLEWLLEKARKEEHAAAEAEEDDEEVMEE